MALANTTRIATIAEVTQGVTPATPAYDLVREVTDDFIWEIDSAPDPELNPDRTRLDVIRGAARASGSLSSLFHANTVWEAWMEAIMGTAWSGDDLVPGFGINTFTLEKTYIGVDEVSTYHRYAGVLPSTLQLSMSPNEKTEAVWGFVGGVFTPDSAEIAASTYATPSPTRELAPTFRGGSDWALTVTGGPPSLGLMCWTSLQLNLDSGNLATACLGADGETDLHQGELSLAMSAEVLYPGHQVTNHWVAGTDITMFLTLTDSTPSPNQHSYVFDMPRVRVVSAGMPTPAGDSQLIQPLELEAITPTGGELLTITRDTV